jgi:hypothetical protein
MSSRSKIVMGVYAPPARITARAWKRLACLVCLPIVLVCTVVDLAI